MRSMSPDRIEILNVLKLFAVETEATLQKLMS